MPPRTRRDETCPKAGSDDPKNRCNRRAADGSAHRGLFGTEDKAPRVSPGRTVALNDGDDLLFGLLVTDMAPDVEYILGRLEHGLVGISSARLCSSCVSPVWRTAAFDGEAPPLRQPLVTPNDSPRVRIATPRSRHAHLSASSHRSLSRRSSISSRSHGERRDIAIEASLRRSVRRIVSPYPAPPALATIGERWIEASRAHGPAHHPIA